MPYPQYFNDNFSPGEIGDVDSFAGRIWTIIFNTLVDYFPGGKVFRITWTAPGDEFTTNIFYSNLAINASYVPASVFNSANLTTDDEKVAFMLVLNCNTNMITDFNARHILNTLRLEITNINPHILIDWNRRDTMNPTESQLIAYDNSVHGKNYRDIYNYILSRIEGSSEFSRIDHEAYVDSDGDINVPDRLEYFWTAPVRENELVIWINFLSKGDIATIQQVTH